VSAVVQLQADTSLKPLISRGGFAGNPGWALTQSGGVLAVRIHDGSAAKTALGTTSAISGAWHCVTVVIDARAANAARIYLDGVDDTSATNDLSGLGSIAGTNSMAIGGQGATANYYNGGVARTRISYAAVTLAQHRALCGSWGLPVKSSHRAANDMSWTQSGGARCYPSSATTATCYPGGAPAARWAATGFEWATDAQGAVNRIPYSTAIDCTNWTCNGTADATTTGQVAPDGSATATEITVGTWSANALIQLGTGYGASVTLYPAFWVKCSTGTLRVVQGNGAIYGDWRVNCAAVAGQWMLIASGHSAVTEITAWVATSGGGGGIAFASLSGTVTATIWAPTITEESTTGAVIPTAAAAVDTGVIAWTIDNSTGSYWRAGASVLQTLDTVDGTCFVTGSTLRLSGAGGSECVGGWGALKVWQ
jgi:hypothetical protein